MVSLRMDAPGSTCTWARSPSYLYSQVKGFPSNLSSTSDTPVMGLASMGFTGTPGWKHTSRSRPCPAARHSSHTLPPAALCHFHICAFKTDC